MSEEPKTLRKAKKAERDAARRLGGRKARKLAEDEIPNLPGDPIEEDGSTPPASETQKTVTSEPSSKKRKRTVAEDNTEDAKADTPKERSKRKKARKTNPQTEGDDGTEPTQTKSRFIVFVGNLPYSTTDSTLRAHFAKLEPFTLRHRTDPQTKKSKGFAFLEFENYDRMKTCLKLYHHSIFDPDDQVNGGRGKGNGRGGRRINVELTAGGGGKTEGRKEKIRVKNQRLEEQRQRRAEQERKAEERKAAKGGKGESVVERKVESAEMETVGMHPSRLAQLNS